MKRRIPAINPVPATMTPSHPLKSTTHKAPRITRMGVDSNLATPMTRYAASRRRSRDGVAGKVGRAIVLGLEYSANQRKVLTAIAVVKNKNMSLSAAYKASCNGRKKMKA